MDDEEKYPYCSAYFMWKKETWSSFEG